MNKSGGKGERLKGKMPCRGKRTQPGATPWVMDRIQRCALQGQKIKINR